jgi:polysaccharide biosynthesis protein PslG
MDTSTTQRANHRTRAMLRLRNLTIGTALVSVAATSGLGWLAANTDAGSTATVTSVSSTTTTTTTSGSTSSDTSGSSSATSTATPTPTTSTSSTTGVSGSTGKAQVSTGGS